MVRLTPSDGSTSLAPRYINHMTMEAFYQIYLMWANGAALDESEIAGCWCFRKTYDTQWKSTLRMRTVSQHARCSTCAEFSARCNKAACESDRLKLEAAQKGHLLNVHQYRLIQGRLNTLSETEGSNILKIDLDGLDQNKTKFPRNLASSKTLSSCWRPQLHLVGVIVWGVVEGYVILPPDVAKDSSCEATLVMKAVDWAHEELSRHGRSLPEHLVIETDNCVREGKNQIMAKLSASAIITNRFRSVTHIFGQVGHTHGPIDQRLGQAAATFSKQACIESPEDFVDLLKNQFSPIRNRTLKVELLPGSLDMKKYLSQYTVEIGGLVTSHHDPADANHCWRFIRRSDLPVYDDQTGESWAPQEIPKESYPHLPNDCILLVKHLVNSESLSQSPMTLLPASFQDKVKVGVQALPRNLIADRARKEFRRTADVVERDPWLLHKAAKALREWVDNNEKQEWPEIPEPKWWFSTDVRELGVEPTPNGWEKFAPGPVRQVTITPGAAIGGEPKRRGRPPKRKDAEVEKVVPLGEGEQVFGPRSKKRSTVVPPTEEIVPKDLFGAAADLPADPPAPEMPWPTRATFAGRKKPTNEEAGAIFEARRSKFYEMVPSQYWRDGLERDYWNKCVQGGCVDLAVEEFLKDHGAAASNQGAGRGRGRGRGKQAKAKAMPKEPGRNRGRGRSKALGKR
ncbi:unnamed protein product [Durusdinium trenchii]|uniref:DUF7869 domain-containing protein n=1 Tax=Durusdinium trenchii TaxID=1381693 RepID=A0ABP0HLE1_9DINO